MELILDDLSQNFSYQYNYSEVYTASFESHESETETKTTFLRNLGSLLEKTHLKIVTTQNEPLNYAEQLENGDWVGRGAAFEFIKYVKDRFNFNYSLIVLKDGSLGNETSGIFGILSKKEADIAAAFLPVLPDFIKYLDYSPTLDVGEWVVLMKRPLESATGSGLLAPFTVDVWILILTSLICMGPVVALLIFLHKKVCPGQQNLTHNLFACMWFVYGALIKQGSTMFPTADSTRVLFAAWWIFITILTAFYTANLTAFLTLSIFTLPVSKPSDIGAKRYNWITDRGNTIQQAASDVLEAHFRGANAHYFNKTKREIMEDYVKTKNYLYIDDKVILEQLMYNDYLQRTNENLPESERCVFVITTWNVLERERAFAYSKGFKFKPLFDNILAHLVEGGVVKHKIRENTPNALICPLNLKSIERQLRNTDFLLTYYIISCGFGLSLMSFVTEFLLGLSLKSRKQPDQKIEKDTDLPALPPPYHTLYKEPFNYECGKKENINGRDYWVVPSQRGRNIVPIRTPSALLFQYTH